MQQPGTVLLSEVSSKMIQDGCVCVYERLYISYRIWKEVLCILCQTLHFRGHTNFMEFIGFLIAKVEAIMKK